MLDEMTREKSYINFLRGGFNHSVTKQLTVLNFLSQSFEFLPFSRTKAFPWYWKKKKEKKTNETRLDALKRDQLDCLHEFFFFLSFRIISLLFEIMTVRGTDNNFSSSVRITFQLALRSGKKKKKIAKCVFEEKKSLEWLPDTNPQMFQFNVKKINCIVLRYFFPPSLHCQLTDTVRRAWNTGLREDTFSGFFFPPPLPIRKRQTAPRLEKLALIITKRASRDKTSEQFSVPRRYSIDPLFSLSLSLSLSIFLLSLSIF